MAKQKTKRVNLTKKVVQGLTLPPTGRRYVYDLKTPGFCVCVTAGGTRTYYIYRKVDGRPVRYRIASTDDLTVEQARTRAKGLIGDIAKGENPQARKRAVRESPTFGALCDAWMEHANQHKKSASEDQRRIDKFFKTWRSRRLSDIDKPAIKRLHTRATKRNGPYEANRVLALVRAMWKRCADDLGHDGRNPADGIAYNREESRDRYLTGDELPRFFKALAEEPSDTLRDFFLVALLTGVRRRNIESMRWDDLSLNVGTWRIPETKSGQSQLVYLPPAAIGLLTRRQENANGSEFVFPSRSKRGHLVEPMVAWRQLLIRAELEDLRIHDLRRTLGSWQAAAGTSLQIIGKSLGHKSQASTEVYARLGLDAVKESVDKATAGLLTAGGAKLTKNGLTIKKSKGKRNG